MKIVKRKVKNLYELNKKWERLESCNRIWESKHVNLEISGSINPPEIRIVDYKHDTTTIYYVVKK